MRERSVADIVKQDSCHRTRGLAIRDDYAFVAQRVNTLLHKVHSADRVQKACVHGSRIDKITQAELSNARQTLHVRVLQYIEE